jgi:hypothetical protein
MAAVAGALPRRWRGAFSSVVPRVLGRGPALYAIARGRRGGDFLVLAQRRSPRVSDALGLLSVNPKALHQPIGFPHDAVLAREVAVSSTLYRELLEEVLGGREVELAGTQLEPDWYVRASKPFGGSEAGRTPTPPRAWGWVSTSCPATTKWERCW